MTDENQFKRVDWTGDGYQPSDDDDERGAALVGYRGSPGLPADDLELLTFAAKAIGARAEPVEGEQWMALHFDDGRVEHGWNPLRHSDDALALSVRLGIPVDPDGIHYAYTTVQTRSGETLHEAHNGDALSATRRAITRAAAEIGKAMG